MWTSFVVDLTVERDSSNWNCTDAKGVNTVEVARGGARFAGLSPHSASGCSS